ncbi:hypothetical protein [Melghirimyces algeriensis]|uniref:hypothetical protein n=1 Tax=Melghirimyces algeriensis TaxID=910412 RepID=UPI001158FBEE|nr:hypothetical protein [Melghirimyces algeriensis]
MNVSNNKASNKKRPSFWRNQSLVALWTGQGLSSLGTGIYQAGLAWEVVHITGPHLLWVPFLSLRLYQ